jgi:tetratricopeptide (TPR) repeat protein
MVTTSAAQDGCATRLDRVDRALADIRSGASGLTPQQTSVRLAALLSERANLSGSDADAYAAKDVATAALAGGCRHGDLVLTLARVYAENHDLVRATEVLDQCRDDKSTGQRVIRAGILRQRGQLVAAAVEYARLIHVAPTWQHLAGLAGVYQDLTDVETADALFARAADDIDALQMGAFAWVEVQRAQLRLGCGELGRAHQHIARAEIGFGGWRACEQRARWLVKSGSRSEAVEAYRRLAEITGRPDHSHALADALIRVGRPDEAEVHHEAAGHGYRMARLPARYRHHFAEFCLDVTRDLDEALALAAEDYAERPNRHTGQLLAAVLTARGEAGEARLLRDRLDGEGVTANARLRHARILDCLPRT